MQFNAQAIKAPGPEVLHGPYGEDAVFGFVRSLMGEMERRYGDEILPPALVRPIQNHLDREWQSFCRLETGPFFLAEGCAVTGLKVGLYHGALMFQWNTAFYPRPRYPSPETDILALGYFGRYDLYASGTKLHARYGSRADTCSWDCQQPDTALDTAHETALREAQRRAARANVFWGSDFAFPPPLGSVAMPVSLKREKGNGPRPV